MMNPACARRALPIVIIGALALHTGAHATALSSTASVTVLDLRPATESDAGLAKLATAALTAALASEHAGRVTSFQEVESALDASAARALLGCDDERCVAKVAQALDTESVVSGYVGRIGKGVVVYVALLDAKSAAVSSRASHPFAGENVDGAAMRALVRRLVSGDAVATGDQALAELRTAIVFDEYDEHGAKTRVTPVGTCVQGQLLDAGVPLVSPQQVTSIRKRLDPASVLAGALPEDAITPDDADVLLIATVQAAKQAETSSVASYRTDLSLRMVKVDTGEIIVAEQLVGVHPGHSPAMAIAGASKQLCQKVRPAIELALSARLERGLRVVIEVRGARDIQAVDALAARLAKNEPRVARAKVRATREKTAIIDATLRGGDGIALALALMDDAQLEVVQASAGLVTLRVRQDDANSRR